MFKIGQKKLFLTKPKLLVKFFKKEEIKLISKKKFRLKISA